MPDTFDQRDGLLEQRLELHQQWLKDQQNGRRADFARANLSGLDLKGIDLRKATSLLRLWLELSSRAPTYKKLISSPLT